MAMGRPMGRRGWRPQTKGSAAMTPGSNSGNATVSVDLSNASPGGVHPWQLHRGPCGTDDGVFGASDAHEALEVDEQGRASGSVTVPLVMPTEGRFYVSVGASSTLSRIAARWD